MRGLKGLLKIDYYVRADPWMFYCRSNDGNFGKGWFPHECGITAEKVVQ